ncbi:MAG: chorismate mutase [Lachnospiraceae bacterium]|nr:chorismate mutase [Lachnospiraceae bacterium]
MKELAEARKKINQIDEQMAKLFEERMLLSMEIADYKKEHALPIKDPEREEEMIKKNRNMIENKSVEGYYVDFLKNIINLSCAYQTRLLEGLKVSYSGVEGAFSHIAAKRLFPQAELIPCPDFTKAYRSVETGESDCCVLPIENSFAGDVGTVMDLMFSGDLYINQVIDVDIVQNLIASENATVESVKKVLSHPQALEQSDEFINSHGYETIAYSNTALAAKYVKEQNDPTIAAIASAETAELFSLKILDSHINTSRNNTTRFAAFSRSQNKPAATKKRDNEHFILVYTVRNEAGALAQTLNIIGAHGFNMRSLRSRPMKDLLWSYYFYVEAEGNVNTVNGKEMLKELSAICAKLKLVGTYLGYDNEGQKA